MDKIIIIALSIVLGIYIYNLVVGDDEGSIKNTSKGVMEYQIESFKNTP